MTAYSLENKLSKKIVILNAVIFIIIILFINITTSIWLGHEYDESLQAKANVLVTLMKDTPQGLDFDFADEFMPEFDDGQSPEYFQLWVNNKHIFEKSNSLNESELPLSPSATLGYTIQDLTLPDGRDGRMIQIVFYPQIPEDEDRTPDKLDQQKLMTLVLAAEREDLDLLVNTIHTVSITATLIVLFIINSIVKITIRNGLDPLNKMRDQIQLLDVGTLNERIDFKNPPSELRDVIEQFNQLLSRLDTSFYREQRFSSNVAHELRTPIAELRSMAEVALKWPEDIALVKEFYSGVNDASKQMQLIVSNLLALARCEKGDINLKPQVIVLKDFINECWHQHESKNKNILLINRIPSKSKIITSLTEFEIIINNLIENAITYSPEGTDVIVDISHHTDSVTLVISNMAEQLDQADLKLMFDRLWRKSESRSSSEHSGLGLSLVKAYIELIGLRISVSLSDKKIISFNIDGVHTV